MLYLYVAVSLIIPTLQATRDPFRLPTNFYPEHYKVHLNLPAPSDEPEPTNFDGVVEITAKCVTPTNKLKFHANGMTLSSIEVFSKQEAVTVGNVDENNATTIVTLCLCRTIQAGEVVSIKIKYNASFGCSDIKGGGLSFSTKYLMISQNQPTCARSILPCFDEPSFKATFGVTIQHPKQFKALANAEALSVEQGESTQITRFADTPRMSTYIFAIALVNLSSPEISYYEEDRNGVTYGFYGPSEEELEVWSNYTARFMDYFEDYFGINYSMKKLGNLVTAAWWDDIWLNEAFASYFEMTLLNHFNLSSFEGCMFTIVLMRCHECFDLEYQTSPRRATGALEFDNEHGFPLCASILHRGRERPKSSYSKYASPSYIKIYLNAHQYGNADRFDFYKAVSEAVEKHGANLSLPVTVQEFLEPWITRKFHPHVTAQITREGYQIQVNRLQWPIPLWYHWISTDEEMSEVQFTWLLPLQRYDTPLILKPPSANHTICLNPETRAFIDAEPSCPHYLQTGDSTEEET